MNTTPTCAIDPYRVDDIPLLGTVMIQMGIPDILDAHFPTHDNWGGTASIFMFTEPLMGWRNTTARPHRTFVPWAFEMAYLT